MFIYLVQAEGTALGDADRRSQILRRRFGRQKQQTAAKSGNDEGNHRRRHCWSDSLFLSSSSKYEVVKYPESATGDFGKKSSKAKRIDTVPAAVEWRKSTRRLDESEGARENCPRPSQLLDWTLVEEAVRVFRHGERAGTAPKPGGKERNSFRAPLFFPTVRTSLSLFLEALLLPLVFFLILLNPH